MLSNHHTRAVLLALAAFVLLAAAHTWPLVDAPAHWSRADPGDGALNIWAVNWVAHSLRHPSQLFEANIFYPEHLTLAYSEAMMVQGVIAWPVVAAGGSPVLAYNLALLTGLALSGWAFCLLARRWTGSWTAGYVAGSLAAFNAYSLAHIPHLQFQHVEFFAAMLFTIDRLIVTGRGRHAVSVGLALALQGLCSIYLLVFASWMLVFAVAARIREWWRAGPLRMIGWFTAAAAIAAAVLVPYLAEYWRVHALMGFARGAADAEPATWMNYFATSARLHYSLWSKPFYEGSTANTFPGIAAALLMIAAFSDRRIRGDARFRMCAFAALGCIAISMAPWLPFYPVLHRIIPLFQVVRQLADIGQIVLLLVAVLAAFGVASLWARWGSRRWWPAAVVAIFLAVNLEAARAPMGFTWFEGVPAVYDVLARDRTAVVVELPFPMPQQWFLNAPYMVNSTGYWRPLLNGYSGFRPASYSRHYDMMRKFPSADALIQLAGEGVTHIVVHQHEMNLGAPDDRYNPFEQVQALQLVARDADILIYRLR